MATEGRAGAVGKRSTRHRFSCRRGIPLKTILLIGRNGQVGWELQRALPPLGRIVAPDRNALDLTQPDSIRQAIRDTTPNVIVNTAGYTNVDKAEAEPELAMQVNAVAPGILAEEAKRAHALLVHYSTDYVFDGTKPTPYVEDDPPNPVNEYGKSKLAGERAIAAVACAHLILRTSWLYSARGSNFVRTILRLAREQKEIAVVTDQIGSPTSARSLAVATGDLLGAIRQFERQGHIFHLSSSGYASRFQFAMEVLQCAKQLSGTPSDWATLRATTSANYPLPAARPLNASTSKEKVIRIFGIQMPTWQQQLHDFMTEILGTNTEEPPRSQRRTGS